MFDPNKLQATRVTASAKRSLQKWALEVLDKEKNKHYDALKNATINIREIQCNDPLCATTGEIDTVVSLTTPLINLTSKILKSCVNCTQVDVIGVVTELCRRRYKVFKYQKTVTNVFNIFTLKHVVVSLKRMMMVCNAANIKTEAFQSML